MAFSKLKAWFRGKRGREASLLPGEWLEIIRQETLTTNEQLLRISKEVQVVLQENHNLRAVKEELLMQNKVLRERDRYICAVHATCLRDLRSLVTNMAVHGADSEYFKYRCSRVEERMDAGHYDLKI